ncbi:MAG TPA: S8 family serine peptidase, partial [Mycobacteriales bacterium]
AFDGVSTTTFGTASTGTSCVDGFRGTSAATPHVTGAAALVKSANPSFDAAQIENYLEQHATPKGTANEFGHGVLGMGPQQTPQAPQGDTYQPLATPTRILDTRTTNGGHFGKIGSGEIFTLTVPGLPADATAVAINVTGTAPTNNTHIDVFPVTYTGTSTLNLVAKQTAAVFTMVRLGPNHTIKVRNQIGWTDAIVDLLGSFTPNGGATYVSKNPPERLLDTRTTNGGHLGMIGPGETFALQVRGRAGVPDDATSVIVNVTGVNQTTSTYLEVYPSEPTDTSTLNLDGTSLRANLTAVGIGSDGKIRIHNLKGSLNVIVDLQGWFVPTGGARFVAMDPMSRIVDTRTGTGLHLGWLKSGKTMDVQGSRLYGVPYNATAVAINLTVVYPKQRTFLTAWPAGLPRPTTSNVNAMAGQTVPNAAVVGTGTNGMVSIFNDILGDTHVVADIYGYFIP